MAGGKRRVEEVTGGSDQGWTGKKQEADAGWLASSHTAVFSNRGKAAFNGEKSIGSALFGDFASGSSSRSMAGGAADSLDSARAAKCLATVRKLNTQFAEWVMQRQQNSPDSLWLEGVSDYVKYCEEIMTDYSDVVSWLKSQGQVSKSPSASAEVERASAVSEPAAATAEGATAEPSASSSQAGAQFLSKPSPSITPFAAPFGSSILNPPSVSQPSWPPSTTSLPPPSTSSLFNAPSQLAAASTVSSASAGSASSAPSSFFPSAPSTFSSAPSFLGSNSSVRFQAAVPAAPAGFGPERHGGEGEEEEDEDGEAPGSPSVKRAEEEGVEVVFESKAKLFAQRDKTEEGAGSSWKDRGSGTVMIKVKTGGGEGGKGGKTTASILFRNEVGKVLCNAALYPNLNTVLKKNMLSAALLSVQDDIAGAAFKASVRLFMFKMPSAEAASEFHTKIQENSPN